MAHILYCRLQIADCQNILQFIYSVLDLPKESHNAQYISPTYA